MRWGKNYIIMRVLAAVAVSLVLYALRHYAYGYGR